MFIDAHCHLQMIENLDKVVDESASNGIKFIFSSSVDLNSMKKNLKIAKSFNEVECCLGIHPSNVLSMQEKEIDNALKFLIQNISFCKAVGEIGVDFKHAKTEEQKEKQIKLYKKQLVIAQENSLPVVVHSRFAEKKSLEILSEFKGKVLLHWFDGNKKAFEEGIKRNYFFSVGPAILFNQDYLKKALEVPLELLMLETDSPVEFQGKQAQPFWVKKVAEKLAQAKNTDLREIEEKTTRNAEEFFSI